MRDEATAQARSLEPRRGSCFPAEASLPRGANATAPHDVQMPVAASTVPPHAKQGMVGGGVYRGLAGSNLPHRPHPVQG